jgi:hypothetical protein
MRVKRDIKVSRRACGESIPIRVDNGYISGDASEDGYLITVPFCGSFWVSDHDLAEARRVKRSRDRRPNPEKTGAKTE